jgi:hypothetical protein
MSYYKKKVEEISSQLDEILGLKKIGKGIKSLMKGMGQQEFSDKDITPSSNKSVLDRYVDNASNNSSIKKYSKGTPELFKFRENYAQSIDENLLVKLFFDVDDEESDVVGKVVWKANEDKILKKFPDLSWLFKGDWKAKNIGIGSSKKGARGSIGGKLITFRGIWNNGTFMGVLAGGKILGGQMIDAYYLGLPDGFKIDPWDFKSGGSSVASGFVMGKRLLKPNKEYKKISLIQVPVNTILKITDNSDKVYHLEISKSINYDSLDFIINDKLVPWKIYTDSPQDFKKTIIEVGNTFSIPNVISIDKNIQKIELKTSEYEYEKKEAESEEGNEKTVSKDYNKFNIVTKRKGWKPGGKGYYNLDIEKSDSNTIESIDKFKKDLNSGKFFKYLNMFKRLIDEGRIDGYGNFPSLAFIFPKQQGSSYKTKDDNRDKVMDYFSNFRTNVINNFSSQKVSDYYLKKLKSEILEEKISNKKTKPNTKKSNSPTRGVRAKPISLDENFYNSKIKDIVKSSF